MLLYESRHGALLRVSADQIVPKFSPKGLRHPCVDNGIEDPKVAGVLLASFEFGDSLAKPVIHEEVCDWYEPFVRVYNRGELQAGVFDV